MKVRNLAIAGLLVVGSASSILWWVSWKRCEDRVTLIEEVQAARKGGELFNSYPAPVPTFAAHARVELNLQTLRCQVTLPEVPKGEWLEKNIAFRLEDKRVIIVFWAPLGTAQNTLSLLQAFLPEALSVPPSWKSDCEALCLKYAESWEELCGDVSQGADLSRAVICELPGPEFRRRVIVEAYRRELSPVGEIWRVQTDTCSGIAYQASRNQVRVHFASKQSGRHCEVSVFGPGPADAKTVVDELMAHMVLEGETPGKGARGSDTWSYGEPTVRVLN